MWPTSLSRHICSCFPQLTRTPWDSGLAAVITQPREVQVSREEGPVVVSLPGHPGRGPETLPCLPHLWVLVHHAGLVAPRLAQLFGTLIKFLLCVPDTTPHPDLLSPDTVSPTGASHTVWMGKLRHGACRVQGPQKPPDLCSHPPGFTLSLSLMRMAPITSPALLRITWFLNQEPLAAPGVHVSTHSCLSAC